MKRLKRIGVDARFYGPACKGLGRYTKEVTDRVIALMPDCEFVVFLSPENYDSFPAATARVKKVLVTARWYTLAEQLVLPWLIWRERIGLFHSPHLNIPVFAPCRLVVTIHDLISIHFPSKQATTLSPIKYQVKQLGLRFVTWAAIMRSRVILAVSEFTKQDVVGNYRIPADKIVVTHEGVTALHASGSQSGFKNFMTEQGIRQPYLLYVGNAYPHKNLEGLVRAMSELRSTHPEVQLVLVGKEDYFYSRIKALAKSVGLRDAINGNDTVVFPGFVPDEMLDGLFADALAYVFPSLYEGFGLPPVEAMSHGLPVVSSNASSLPEILGEAASYFDPNDQASMTRALREVIEDGDLRLELKRRGLAQAGKYSWDACASLTAEAIRVAAA